MAAPKGNKFAVGNPGTRKTFETVEELQAAIDVYFEECDSRYIEVYDKQSKTVKEISKPIPYTIEGLCLVLGVGRETLLNYEKQPGYEDYFDTIKEAKLKIQKNKVERGLDGESSAPVTIFDLKNNHGYKDKSEHDHTVKLSLVDAIKQANEPNE